MIRLPSRSRISRPLLQPCFKTQIGLRPLAR
jgi:hypothetical protein